MLHKYINESEAINQRLKGFIWYDCSLYRIFIRLLTNTWMESNEEVDEKRDEEKAVCTFVFVWIVTKRLNVPQRRCIGVFVYICVQFIYRNVVGLYVLNVEKSSNIVVTTAPKPIHSETCTHVHMYMMIAVLPHAFRLYFTLCMRIHFTRDSFVRSDSRMGIAWCMLVFVCISMFVCVSMVWFFRHSFVRSFKFSR